ncbi:unnamed protein product [Paramecium primaurelia]|uniref:Sperm-tail PG-rich repeat-containing protein 2 n=1 Tax=Paramecium primaurelia TaxID=5886 RepID=A0A8S1LRP5_PARPR|nr:unnamed protein product [Paramecium primaurelia]
MAFVYRSENRVTYIPKTEQVGPGQYDHIPEIENRSNHHPFNSTVERINKSNQPKPVPGPGTYNLQGSFECQKVIFQSDEQEIKILEVPKPISVFRSTTVRFKEDRFEGPGPTQYFQEERKKFHSAGQPNRSKKMNVLEQLVKENKYLSIPSIPSNVHQGYIENKDNQLEQNPIDSSNDVGPGSYDLKSTFNNTKPRGVSWHKPRSQDKKDNKSPIGPGYYDICGQSQPMYQMKPTTAFSSKQSRNSEFRFQNLKNNTGYIKKGLDNKQYSFHQSTNPATTARETDADSEYSYIEDATPGPGYYENASTQQTISQFLNKSQAKGSIKTRTKRFHTKSQHTPGPGSYQVEVIAHRYKGAQPPFLMSKTRFEEQFSETPAPGQYKAANTMEQRLIQKLMKAPLGQFGVNENRFKEQKLLVPGPGSYEIDKNDDTKKDKKLPEQKGTYAFMSHAPKSQDLSIPNINPAPGAYNVNQHTIANKIIKPEEDDPKLAVIKPPFGVGSERWKIKEANEDEEDDEPFYLEKSAQNQLGLFKKKKKDPPPFMCKQERFSKSVPKDNIPGPMDYADGMYPNWNKRTFNIIFAEI